MSDYNRDKDIHGNERDKPLRDDRGIDTSKERDTNPDAITGAPGSHPVGTGVGAAAGGAAGAAVGSMGGPAGTVIGAAVGAVAGGLAGKGVAEGIDPTEEDAYWREHHREQTFATGTNYDDYAPAYRAGYMGAHPEQTFEEREGELRRYYEAEDQAFDDENQAAATGRTARDTSAVPWDEGGQNAARAAYERARERQIQRDREKRENL